ncbi:MAG: glycosyltransferase [Lachnospiraceae bacterium]|nr:glycosyltransferase [Lachnospiraceae bacterium]
MFLAVIIVSYNPGDRLKATLGSLLSQEERDFRVIVKDAGSADGSDQAARKELADPRVTYVSQSDRGIYDGMNQALEILFSQALRGEAELPEWIYFLNCGDLLHDERVLGRVREAVGYTGQESPSEAAGARETASEGSVIDGDNERIRIMYGDIIEMRTGQRAAANPRMDAFACFRNVPCHQACFYHASLLFRERFETRWRVRADYEHFLRCVLSQKVRTKALGFVICDYEGGGFSESREGSKRSAEEHREITARYFTRSQRLRYRMYLILTLQPLRAFLAGNRITAGLYQGIRSRLLKR